MNKKILILNMGMKSIRSIIFDQWGNKLASAACPLSTGLNESRVIQEPNEWWDCAVKVVQKSVKDLGGETVAYVTVTASASCLVYVDENGEALDSCIMVSDKRAEKECAELTALESTGFFGSAYGGGSVAGSMLAKILWVKNNQPENYAKTRYFLSPDDYLIAKLTGKYVTDELNALKLYYDVQTESYPAEAFRKLGIDPAKLPAVMPVGANLGAVKGDAASLLHLPMSAEVILTTYDAMCSFFGSGVTEEGEASDVSGTVTVLRTLTYRNDLRPSSAVFATPYVPKACQIVGGSNNLGGGLIEWVKQCCYSREEYPYEVMEKEAGESSLGAGGLLFLPYLLGERAPIWDNTVRGMFFGLERYHTRKDMTRAVFESTGFVDMDFINEIEKTGVTVRNIRVSGGLARINLVSQIKADVTGKEVKVLSEFETTAVGAAMLALEAVGVFSDMEEAAKVFAEVRMIVQPSYKQHIQYQKMYCLFKQVYLETKELFKQRREVCTSIYPNQECTIENI